MKKKTTRKRMAKQQNSVSENFIRRIRHSRKSQMFSVLILAVGLVGIYLVIALLSPPNYGEGEGVGRRALSTRSESLRERFGLRVSDAFNRLRFVASGEKDNPEWIQPVLLPAPSEDVQKSLPDSTIFGSPEEQFIASLPEEERRAGASQTTPSSDNAEASNNDQDSETAQQPSTTPITRDPAVMDDEDFGETYGEYFDINNNSELLKTCIYERET